MILGTLVSMLGGLLGTVATSFVNYKMKKLEAEEAASGRAHEIALLHAESEARIAEVQANIQVAQVQTEGAIMLEEARAYSESQRQGNRKALDGKWVSELLARGDGLRFLTVPLAVLLCFLLGLADVMQACMRSVLTLYSAAIATLVTWRAWEVVQGAGLDTFSTAQAMEIWGEAARVVYMLAVTLITWWFGDRRVATNLMHQAQQRNGAQ